MSQLLIEIDSEEDKALLLALLPRLHARVINSEDTKLKKDRFIKGLHEIAARGGVGESFGDASEWQREIRSLDRVLDGRGE